jgi:4'-phosphopantetheinyl transferase
MLFIQHGNIDFLLGILVMKIIVSNIRSYQDFREMNNISNARRQKALDYVKTDDKIRSMVTGLLMQSECGIVDDEQLTIGEKGKPYLTSGKSYFNISHSGEYVVLAIADTEVGVDIEFIKPYSMSVAHRCFTPAEIDWMVQKGNDEAFYTLWTAKESVMKAFGMGFSMVPSSFSVLPIDSSPHNINNRVWFLDWLTHNGYVICRAVENIDSQTEFILK